MKKTSIVFGMALISFLVGCTKEDIEVCYECKEIEVVTVSGVIESASETKQVFCDKTEAEISELETNNTKTETEGSRVTTTTYTCELKN